MRHVMSLVAGAIVAPLVWVLVAAGQGAFQSGQSVNGVPNHLTIGSVVLVGIGLVAGLITTLRTSPLGALFAGLVFLGASVYLYLDQTGAMHLFTTTWTLQGIPLNLFTPLSSGLLAFTGGLFLMSIFSPDRWNSDEDSGSEDDPETWTPIPAESQNDYTEQQDYWSYR